MWDGTSCKVAALRGCCAEFPTTLSCISLIPTALRLSKLLLATACMAALFPPPWNAGTSLVCSFTPKNQGQRDFNCYAIFANSRLLNREMLTKRIIACLDVDAGRVVKGVQFSDLRD